MPKNSCVSSGRLWQDKKCTQRVCQRQPRPLPGAGSFTPCPGRRRWAEAGAALQGQRQGQRCTGGSQRCPRSERPERRAGPAGAVPGPVLKGRPRSAPVAPLRHPRPRSAPVAPLRHPRPRSAPVAPLRLLWPRSAPVAPLRLLWPRSGTGGPAGHPRPRSAPAAAPWPRPRSSAPTTDCLHLREQCINAGNGCESVWNVVEDACNISVLGNRCKAEDSVGCNRIIQVLADEYPEFRNCVCTTDDICRITTLIGKLCSINKDYLASPSGSDPELGVSSPRSPRDPGSCGVARRLCREQPRCWAAHQSFQRHCRAPAGTCSSPRPAQCLLAWKELRTTPLGRCTCPEPRRARCIKIWKGIFNNPCLQHSQESQASGAGDSDDDYNGDLDGEKNLVTDTNNISMETKLQWGLSALSKQAHTTNRSCLDVNRECVEDEVCNKQLSLYLKLCSVNKKCNVEGCQAAIRFFYGNMPFEVAQMMIFCDCIQHDESCHRAKELLHGKPCAVTVVPPPSCLNVIQMCEENELCRKKYTTFRSKCWRHVTKKCYNDEACLETLLKDDVPCSATTDCKAAFVSIWGTMLLTECTCQNVPPMEQPLCELFHHMLHSKSCFRDLRQISIQKKGFHWVNTEMPGEKISGAQLHSSAINGETVYIIAYSSCIALILGIVLLTLLKIRACRTKHESRRLSPDHSSETFMAHYKSHR
ncbi:GDNF family receptor alpha-like [Melozone crissalis]|uniref:GDNF family receptor alpha-like n=1 Tax=Melozone crissalis TaxID=40204 RepID=UPI0023DCD5E6|nr:GDNF family receptor alpha-like [Melozone crissalis]